MEELNRILRSTGAYRCYECGRCTSECPIARFRPGFSPRRTVARATHGEEDQLALESQIWSCLTCSACESVCPSQVQYSSFIRGFRTMSRHRGHEGRCSHGGVLQSWMRTMADSDRVPERLGWVTEDLQFADRGEHFYFVGCLPFFDALFAGLHLRSTDIAVGTVRILNALGIRPVLSREERCCGHDLLWQGDQDGFRKLARRNLEAIRSSGAKTLITSCAECARTIKLDYEEHLGALPFRVTHLAEFLAGNDRWSSLPLRHSERVVTYQDPCRLGRHQQIYEEPRKVIRSLPGVELREMDGNRKSAVCCGTSTWTNCDRYSKQIQSRRLAGAARTGAEILITGCPKCAIHFRCAQLQHGIFPEDSIRIKDLAVLVSEALDSGKEQEAPARDPMPRIEFNEEKRS